MAINEDARAAAAALLALPGARRAALCALLMDLASDAERRAQAAIGPLRVAEAVYWKAVAVNAEHAACLLRRGD